MQATKIKSFCHIVSYYTTQLTLHHAARRRVGLIVELKLQILHMGGNKGRCTVGPLTKGHFGGSHSVIVLFLEVKNELLLWEMSRRVSFVGRSSLSQRVLYRIPLYHKQCENESYWLSKILKVLAAVQDSQAEEQV